MVVIDQRWSVDYRADFLVWGRKHDCLVMNPAYKTNQEGLVTISVRQYLIMQVRITGALCS
jgi:hypothetical protein